MFLTELLGYIAVVHHHERQLAIALTASVAINVALNMMFIPMYGARGAALVTIGTELLLLAQYLWGLRRFLAAIRWRDALGGTFTGAAAMGAVLLLSGGAPPMVSFAFALLTYAAVLAVSKTITVADLRFVAGLVKGRTAGQALP
jgi:O-antigen/teichoic acid export membrane protein